MCDFGGKILEDSILAGTDHDSIVSKRKSKELPPGPTPLPLIGNLHLLGKRPHKSLADLAQIYGPITFLKLGWMTTIVISSSSTAKEVLKKQDLAFSSRSVPDAVHVHNHSQHSAVWLPVGPKWRSLRKIMTSVMFSTTEEDYFPLLKKIDPQGIRRRSGVYLRKLLELFDVVISERLDSRKARKIAGNGDLLDLCLNISVKNPEEMDMDLFKNLFLDLFFGGTDTTTSTIEWAMGELLRNPEVMMKAKAELD